MRFSLFILILTLRAVAVAGLACVTIHSQGPPSDRMGRLAQIESQLKDYFGEKWQTADELSDAFAARILLPKIQRFGSDTDIQILETYVEILRATGTAYFVREPGFYVDLNMGWRPKSSHFQERHWDWNILDGYFFNSPSTLTLTKERDLSYLQHVLKTAQALPSRPPMREMLQEANHTWALKGLESEPQIKSEYLKYVGQRSYSELYSKFMWKAKAWKNEAPTSNLRHRRYEKLRNALQAFRSSNSSFDLFLLDRYFDLTRQLQHTAYMSELMPSPRLQLTNWDVFEKGLSYGSLDYLTDFLFQNSHDMESKKYLATILQEMKQLVPQSPIALKDARQFSESPFDSYFSQARKQVEARITKMPAPPQYESDLYIFSPSHQPGEKNPAFLQTVLVRWNPILGKLQSFVTESIPVLKLPGQTFTEGPTVSNQKTLKEYIRNYFDRLRKDKAYAPEEIAIDEKKELAALQMNTIVFAFTRPGTTELLAMMRVFDGTDAPIYIEREFPHLQLPERKLKEPVLEIGRVLSSPDIQAHSLDLMMARVADYFSNTNQRGSVYADSNQSATVYYRRKGMSVAYTPEQLQQAQEATPLWVLKMPVSQWIEQNTKPYESVQTRTRKH